MLKIIELILNFLRSIAIKFKSKCCDSECQCGQAPLEAELTKARHKGIKGLDGDI